MELSRADLLLILSALDFMGYIGYADKFGAFLATNEEEQQFLLKRRDSHAALAEIANIANQEGMYD